MDISTLTGLDENHPTYDKVATANLNRLHGLMESMVEAALDLKRPMVTHHLIKGLNSHAIAGLHSAAGQYRATSIHVGQPGPDAYIPPEPGLVQVLMDDFVREVEDRWESSDAVSLAAWVLWRINFIHPFVNGNGRTARAVCYYIICAKIGGWLPGEIILPNRLRQHREDYYKALRSADGGEIQPLTELVKKLLDAQLT